MSEAQSVAAFGSLQAMRAVHRDLLQSARGAGTEATAAVEGFLASGVGSGVFLDEPADRDVAQGLLDYWQAWGIRLGVDLPDAVLHEFDPDRAPELPDDACPYVGLDAFGAAMADRFHGRSRPVAAAVERLAAETFLAVLGPSGSGKSSVVFAGVLPRLRAALPPETRWPAPFVPGGDPLAALAKARDEAGEAPAVFVVDQFEEVFTLCDDDRARQAFVEGLLALAADPARRHRVIVTMRTDFETYVVRFRGLWERFHAARIDVPPLTIDELREAIVAPAETVGLVFESGIPDQLAEELVGQPSSLPLLQFALRRLWDRRRRNRVTWAAYKAIGGGLRALEVAADELYDGLVEQQRRAAKRILLRLVRPGEGLEVTRARVSRADLFEGAESRDWVEEALAALVAARLVRVTGEGDRAQVEIGHEALVRNWPRFIEWVAERRDALRSRFVLSNGALRWNASGHEARLLLRGAELREALRQPREELSRAERAYVDASGRAATRLRRLKTVAVGAAAAALAAIAVLWIQMNFAWNEAGERSQEARSAQAEAKQAAAEAQRERDNAKEAADRAAAARTDAANALVAMLEELTPVEQLVGRAHDLEKAFAALRSEDVEEGSRPQAVKVRLAAADDVARLQADSGLHLLAFDRLRATLEAEQPRYAAQLEELRSTLGGLIAARTAALEAVNDLPPTERAKAMVGVARAAVARADIEGARAKFGEALQLVPSDIPLSTEYAALLAKHGLRGEARDVLLRSVVVCRNTPACGCGRVWSLLADNFPEDACAWLAQQKPALGPDCTDKERQALAEVVARLERAGQLDLGWVPSGGLDVMRTEVTQAQYHACVEAGACREPLWDGCAKSKPGFVGDELPVACLDAERARQFARFAGARIPAAEEWERVARGDATDARHYPWGDELPTCARAVLREDQSGPDGRPQVRRGCGEQRPWTPCSRPDGNNPQGVCDLIGNVDELVELADAATGRTVLVATGGNWFLPAYSEPPSAPSEGKKIAPPAGASKEPRHWARIGEVRPIESFLPSTTVGLRLVRDRQPTAAPGPPPAAAP